MCLVATRLLCLVVIASLTIPPFASAQDANTASNGSTSGTGQNPSPTASSAAMGPLSDYVPCIFSDEDQFSMRAQPSKEKRLDESSAGLIFDNALIEIETALSKYSQTQPEFVNYFQKSLSDKLSAFSLVGLTIDQAVAHIKRVIHDVAIVALTQVQTAQKSSGQSGRRELHTDQEVKDAKQRVAAKLATTAEESAQSTIQAATAKNPISNSELINSAKQAIANSVTSLGLDPDYQAALMDRYLHYTAQASEFRSLRPVDIGDIVEQAAMDAGGYPFSPKEAPTGADVLSEVLKTLDVTGATQRATAGAQPKPFQPPNDVSCSMAVLSWKETRDIFGRRVANTFVAIQVTLRNLNTKNEFLVHDIQVAVDTGVSQDYFGRFQAGRDKLLVRAVAQRGQSEDRRNIVLNTLQTVGAIAAAASLTGGTVQFKDAVAVFQGAFLPGFANIFPDHTVDQLNHINDLVFSASNTSKVVVPVQGSVPLVTFISEKPIEQLPFAWCGRLPHKGINPEQLFGWGADRNCNFNGGKHNPGYVTPYRYDRHGRQLPSHNAGPPSPSTYAAPSTNNPKTSEEQLKEKKDKDKLEKWEEQQNYPVGPTVAKIEDENGDEKPIEDGLPPWDDLKYKDWRGAAVRMLQEHTFVVVGGVHIQQIVTQPRVASLSCPQLTSGKVDLSQTDDSKMVSCTLSGAGLSLITGVNLQKNDNGKIAGKIKVNSDGNTAALTFAPKDLCAAEGDYGLYVVYKSDTQKDVPPLDTGNKVSLAPQPVITDSDLKIDTSNKKKATLTLQGSCMKQMKGVSLATRDDDPSPQNQAVDSGATDDKATATFTSANNFDAKLQIWYKIDAQSTPVKPKPPLTVTPH